MQISVWKRSILITFQKLKRKTKRSTEGPTIRTQIYYKLHFDKGVLFDQSEYLRK